MKINDSEAVRMLTQINIERWKKREDWKISGLVSLRVIYLKLADICILDIYDMEIDSC